VGKFLNVITVFFTEENHIDFNFNALKTTFFLKEFLSILLFCSFFSLSFKEQDPEDYEGSLHKKQRRRGHSFIYISFHFPCAAIPPLN